MRMIDMFSGMGNMRLGFEQAGWKCVYSVEFDKHKREIYKVIYGKEPDGNNITEIRGTDLPRAELWAFGAPCQDFSIAGKRAGLGGDRSGLVREVFRLVRESEYKPEWLLYENVKGMLSSNCGWDFAAIQAKMGELGYDVEWQILNSKNFGVPQNRERVFTIGHLRKYGERKVFPITGQDNKIACQQFSNGQGIAYCLDTGYGKGISESSVNKSKRTQVIQIGNIHPDSDDFKNHSAGRVYDKVGLSPTLNTMQGGQRQPMILDCIAIKQATSKGYDMAHVGDSINLTMPNSKTRRGRVGKGVAQTLDTQCNQATLQNSRIRRLTPRECMRLQGVPDSITNKLMGAGISDTQMYRAAGDAVTVNVIQAIASKILSQCSR